jgi:hypothetical protein
MLRTFLNRLHDERGVAIVTAMLLSMVVVTLGVTSVGMAVHNSEQSAMDRRRVQGVSAAEAGINWYYSHLQSGSASSFVCSKQMTLTGTPSTSFTAGLYNPTTGAPLICPLSESTLPETVLIRSKGSGVNEPTPARTLESEVRLIGEPGGPFGATAIYSNSSISWPANVKILGNEASDTDVYVNGNAAMASASIVYGNLYASGSITLRGNSQVRRDAWANTTVSLSNSSRVLGGATSSTSSISVSQQAKILQDARAGTSISAGSGAIGGLRIPNSPQAAPPVSAFPVYSYVQADWEAEGYTVYEFSGVSACTTAKNFIKTLSGIGFKILVRILTDCTMTFSKDAPTVAGSLAIVSDGGMTNGNNTSWVGSGGGNLHMFFGIDNDGAPCDVTWGSSGGVSGDISTLIYTPCTLSFGSNGSISKGQLFAGNVSLKPSFTMNYAPVPVPGFGTEVYEEDVLYLREVVGS